MGTPPQTVQTTVRAANARGWSLLVRVRRGGKLHVTGYAPDGTALGGLTGDRAPLLAILEKMISSEEKVD